MEDTLSNLKLVIIPCREPIPFDSYKEYNAAYQLWHSVWSKTLKDLDGRDQLYSDEFTRHHFMSVIFEGDKAISMMCYSAVDMGLGIRRNDSWFSSWSPDVLNKISKDEGEGLFAAWFCTDPSYRKSRNPNQLNVSKVIIEAFGKLILDGGYNLGYGVTRNNRSVGKYAKEAGCISVDKTIAHGCEVDLVVFEPEHLKEVEFSYSIELKKLWENRLDLRRNDENKLPRTAQANQESHKLYALDR